MVHLHDQIADLGLEFLDLRFQLALSIGRPIDQPILVVSTTP
jgi:hypothetical protein